MSFNFSSLVSSIKDKSSQAMATLSSDLKEFTTIVQEDISEVAETVRKAVEEKKNCTSPQDSQSEGTSNTSPPNVLTEEGTDASTDAAATKNSTETATESNLNTTTSSFFGFKVNKAQLEVMGATLFNSADEYLSSWTDSIVPTGTSSSDGGALSPGETSTETIDEQAQLVNARRFRLLALQEDPETYIEPPMDMETFQRWLTSLSSDERQSLQGQVLEHYPTVGRQLKELVPTSVQEDDFWTHYLYKASLLAAQEQRSVELLAHHEAEDEDEEEVTWEEEEEEEEEEEVETEKSTVPTIEPLLDTTPSLQPSGPSSSQLSVASSDGESWVDVDDKRDISPPVSSSSGTPITRVPEENSVPTSSPPPPPSNLPTMAVEKINLAIEEEEDVDWGNDGDEELDNLQKTEKSSPQEWGEWS